VHGSECEPNRNPTQFGAASECVAPEIVFDVIYGSPVWQLNEEEPVGRMDLGSILHPVAHCLPDMFLDDCDNFIC
jgi:hypothetical protein